jgi:hypothetical protein
MVITRPVYGRYARSGSSIAFYWPRRWYTLYLITVPLCKAEFPSDIEILRETRFCSESLVTRRDSRVHASAFDADVDYLNDMKRKSLNYASGRPEVLWRTSLFLQSSYIKLMVAYQDIPPLFMKPEYSLPCLKQLITGHHLQSGESSPRSHALFKIQIYIILPFTRKSLMWSLPLRFPD